MYKVLIVEDDVSFARLLSKFLERNGFMVETGHTGIQAEKILKEHHIDVMLTDVRLPEYDGITLLSKVSAPTQVIVMTGYAEVAIAVKAIKQGAFDYIEKPFMPEQILTVIQAALKSNSAINVQTNSGLSTGKPQRPFLVSEAALVLEEYISLVAPTDMSVLLIGPSGTGKEVTAKRIHETSRRKKGAFVAIDCGAIPKELASSEFFGHIKGSFTGAINDHIGSFEAAHEGTLFLDEVGNLSYGNQIHLLRVLQERKVKRVGSTSEISVDVRIISATNEDLKSAVEKGTFREDLYHRLNEFSLQIPSLVDRQDDLEALANYFLTVANADLKRNVVGFSDEVWEIFNAYGWPGNIRELQNVVKRAVLLTQGDVILPLVLPKEIKQASKAKADRNGTLSKAEFEKEQILTALKRTNYNKSKAAKLLQITRKTLYNRIIQYDLEV
ncbi:sigma-54-dependent transcriptional regulator [Maribacter chungangensis]|uniref:Sigma-54-dependent transcriptional regulator n=1 Tax=Maribacter chungangensis TaxID=1069117 RepID=A0ABW3B7C7_9FLAO